MPLPTAFSNNTTPTGPQLDGNFAAVGALTTIPCSVSGTNALTLTPLTNTPTVTAYANYLRVSGVAAATNNAATTARVGALAALPVYVDKPSGPVALVGNEIIIGCAFTLVYDAALNAGGGGWHLYSSPASFPFTGGTIIGNLAVTGNTSLTGNLAVAGNMSLTGSLGTLAVAGNMSLTSSLGTLAVAGLFSGATVNGTRGSLSTLTAANLLVGTSLTTLTRLLATQATLAFSVVAANGAQDQTATLASVQLGDCLSVGVTAVPTGAAFSAYIPAAGSVNLRCLNASTVTLGAFTVIARLTALGGAP